MEAAAGCTPAGLMMPGGGAAPWSRLLSLELPRGRRMSSKGRKNGGGPRETKWSPRAVGGGAGLPGSHALRPPFPARWQHRGDRSRGLGATLRPGTLRSRAGGAGTPAALHFSRRPDPFLRGRCPRPPAEPHQLANSAGRPGGAIWRSPGVAPPAGSGSSGRDAGRGNWQVLETA